MSAFGPITERVAQPTPAQVKAARKAVKLTQEEAALLVSPAQERPERTWQGYEVEVGQPGHRAIPLPTWELFLLLTGQHQAFVLTRRVPA